jgi:hypothetical protein
MNLDDLISESSDIRINALVRAIQGHEGRTVRAAQLKRETGVPKSLTARLLGGAAGVTITRDSQGPWFSWTGR